jgi:hypothetical protein
VILHPGQQIDRFVVECALGAGGMAAVYRVRHITLDAVYALKILTIPSAAVRERMLREGRFQATLRHSNIVSVIDILDIHGVLGLLMEYIDGPSLDEWLAAYKPSMREAMAIFGGILSAVDMVHARGIIHRDLKPSNVMLHITDEGMYPRVTDFGIAKSDRLSEVNTGSGATVGTPAYMAPEQFKNAAGVDQRADVFSLGAVLYELVCGTRAFEADNLLALMNAVAKGQYTPAEDLVPDLPDGMRAAIQGALRSDPDHRIPDCKRLAAVLTGQSAVHNIADAMQRRLFRSAPGTVAAMRLREDRRRREEGEAEIPVVAELDHSFRGPARANRRPFTAPVTYDEPIGAFTEDQSFTGRSPGQMQVAGPSIISVMILFLLVLTIGLLIAVLAVWLSAAQTVPVQSISESTIEAGRMVPLAEIAREGTGAAPPFVAPQPLVAPPPAPVVPQVAEPATELRVAPEPVVVRPRPEPVAEPIVQAPVEPVGQIRLSTMVAVRLVRDGSNVSPLGPVPVGQYSVRADFGEGWQDAGSVYVVEGQTTTVTCDDAFLVCRGQR